MRESRVRPGWISPGLFNVTALALIAGTVALKLAVQSVTVEEDRAVGAATLAANLAREGYTVEAVAKRPPRVDARRGDCRYALRVIDPHATFEPIARSQMPTGWAIAYGWRGTWHSAMPRLGPLTEYYVLREFVRTGFGAARAPVILLATAPGCANPAGGLADIRLDLFVLTATANPSPLQ